MGRQEFLLDRSHHCGTVDLRSLLKNDAGLLLLCFENLNRHLDVVIELFKQTLQILTALFSENGLESISVSLKKP